MNTLQAGRLYILCVSLIVWTRPKLKVYFACLFWSAPRTHTHTRARKHTHTHTHTRANTHTHTHTHTYTHARKHTHTHARTHTHFSLRNSISRADCTFNILLSNMSSNLVTVKTAFYNNRQTIDLILTLSFGQGGTNARRCEEKEVVLEETRL